MSSELGAFRACDAVASVSPAPTHRAVPRRSAPRLRLFHRGLARDVLGPGLRAVLWVQGCPHGCGECIAPETWDPRAGGQHRVADVAVWVLRHHGLEGITISGGEPMDQPAALCALIDAVRDRMDLGVVCYTGYVYPRAGQAPLGVRLRLTAARRALLARTDLLVDGPYVADLHSDLLWRGSANQRLIPLSSRYLELIQAMAGAGDCGAGLEVTIDAQGRPLLVGVPSQRGFRHQLETAMAKRGIALRV